MKKLNNEKKVWESFSELGLIKREKGRITVYDIFNLDVFYLN